jgi:hypothetical protein
MDLEIEPDPPADSPAAQDGLTAILPAQFPLATLLRFMPDVALKRRVEQRAADALAINVADEDGPQRADKALADLRLAMDAALECFKDPTSLAHQLHTRLTGLRADFVSAGESALSVVGKRVFVEQQARKAKAEEERKRRQAEADAQAKRELEAAAKEAAARKAPKGVVAQLKAAAKTATAPPVATFSPAPLSSSTTVTTWKARFVDTDDDAEINPETCELTPAQQKAARDFFRAVAEGEVPLVCAAVNWSEVNRRANADRTTFEMAGLEAVEVGGLRAKRRR